MDFTQYKTLSFYAKKNANHGIMEVIIHDGLIKDTTTTARNYLLTKSTWYEDLPTSWTLYEIDISHITGTHTISFVGGYTDDSGNTSSSTSYCDIKFLPTA